MADDLNDDVRNQSSAYGVAASGLTAEPGTAAVVDLQTQLTRAYLSGDGFELERVLALISAANIVLPPKSQAAA